MLIDTGSRPGRAVLAVSQSAAVAADVAELAACTTVEAPPDAGGHAVFQSYHGLAYVVHFVGIAHLAVSSQLLIEVGKRVKAARELVGVPPVVVVFAHRVPGQRLVVVQGVSTHYRHVGALRVFRLQQLCHGLLQGRRSPFLLCPVVRFVEGRDAGHGVLCVLLQPGHVGVDERRPSVGMSLAARQVIAGSAGFLVGSEGEWQLAVHQVKQVHALAQRSYLLAGQRRVARQRVGCPKGYAAYADVLAAHVVDALAHVLFTDPGLVQSPDGVEALSFSRGAECQHHVGKGLWYQILTRRRCASGLCMGQRSR